MGVPAASHLPGLILLLLIVAASLGSCAAEEAGGASTGEWTPGVLESAPASGSNPASPGIPAALPPSPNLAALQAETPTAKAPTATVEPVATATATETPTVLPTATAVPVPSTQPSPASAPPATAALVTRVEPGQGEVALVFNADSFEGHIDSILEALRAHDTRLTFFLTGGYLERYPDRVKQIDADGNEIAGHGYKHVDFRSLADEQIVAQIDRWREAFSELTGKTGPEYWQPPYGYSNDRVRRAAAGHGYTTIYWTIDVLDSVGQPKSKQFVLNRVLQASDNLDGAIILMHVDKDGTVAALPEILDALNERGLRAVTVGELLRR
jgi:peptidoglycan/xylan/chitin deacetylase (PgdA/CDA1 family)